MDGTLQFIELARRSQILGAMDLAAAFESWHEENSIKSMSVSFSGEGNITSAVPPDPKQKPRNEPQNCRQL